METAPRISTLPPASKSQDFEFLRQQGLSEIQNLAAQTWTDHNLHDPGITMLEAMCYALTDAGLRAGMDVKDLIASSTPYHQPEFFTAAQVLPTAPVTLSDIRKILITHPFISNAWLFPFSTAPLGRHSVLLEFANDQLNNNSFVVTASSPPLTKSYTVEIAFPHWNDEDIKPFQEEVVIQAVAFAGPPGNEWNNIVGSLSYVTRALITYQPPVGAPQIMEIWVVADIVTEMEDVTVEAPLILQALLTILTTIVAIPPIVPVLVQLNKRVAAAFESMRVVRRYLSPYRNWCEDFVEFNAVRLQEIGVTATLEVGSGVNIEELLAEVFYRVYRMISPILHFKSLEDQLLVLGTAEVVFDGPLTDAGFLSDSSLTDQQIMEVIYTSDILRIIYQLRSAEGDDVVRRENINTRRIISVKNLKLSNYLDNRPIATGARDCLRLVNSKNHIPRLSLTKSKLTIYRNGIKVAYDNELVVSLFNEKIDNDAQAIISPILDLAIPQGDVYPVKDFYPIQNDLPVVYGVGEAGLPDQATTVRRGQAHQLKGYLFFVEQILAGSQAQLAQFNTFFSARSEIKQTLFQQDLYHIPNIAPLFKGYDIHAANPAVAWLAFQNNTSNGYMQVLNNNTETQAQFLERRNSILDHLLATQGEDMQERAALLFRLATQLPDGFLFSSVSELLAFQNAQRQKALQELVYDKSAYYYDLPELNKNKSQAFGSLLWHDAGLLEINSTGNVFNWIIKDSNGTAMLKQSASAASKQEVYLQVEQVLKLATAPVNYTVRLDGLNRILEVRSSLTTAPLAESVLNYATDPLAQTAIQSTAQTIQLLWVNYNLTSYECRLYHMLGIHVKQRRPLRYAINSYIEIYDEVDADAIIEKRFRLWPDTTHTGIVLLESATNYPGPTDPAALADAQAAVQQMLQYGSEIKNYSIEPSGTNSFILVLTLPDGTALANSTVTFTSEAEAWLSLQKIFLLLSAEGFYVLENNLLYPVETANPSLVIPAQADPYSFQLTIVLPSGYARDFSGSKPVPAQPVLYRSGEFRKYAEQQLRKHCPAHILPRILWVDSVLEGIAIDATAPSFNAFELAYRAWLQQYCIDEVSEAALGPLRTALTTVVNALYLEYYSN